MRAGRVPRLKKAATALLLCALLLARAAPAAAHPGRPPAPHDLASTWNWEPTLLLGLSLGAVVYLRGATALARRSSLGLRGIARQALAFALGWLLLVIALVSPLDALSSGLFSAHMLQHILLMQAAAPLLVLGATPAILAWGLPAAWRQPLLVRGHAGVGRLGINRVWALLTNPWAAWLVHVFALWAWHTPGLYQAALENEALHVLEHLSFLGSGLLFWASVLAGPARTHLWVRLISVFTMALQSGLLGALLTFAPQAWYSSQSGAAPAWGLTALEDQQIAGVLMWAPAGVAYLIAAVGLLGSRLLAMEHEDLAAGQALENRL